VKVWHPRFGVLFISRALPEVSATLRRSGYLLATLQVAVTPIAKYYELFPIVDLAFFFVAGFFQNSRAGIRLRPASARQVVFCNRIAMNWS
jgi:hypothetical protein